MKVATAQYVVVKDKDAYVITLSTTPGDAAKYAGLFETIAQSFRLLQ